MAVRWPEGVRSAGVSSGIKPGGAGDLGLIVFDGSVPWAGTFTQNAAAAAPVVWCRSRRGNDVRALVVNSGNANACTGTAGNTALRVEVEAAAEQLGCSDTEILVASTGPIGVPLPVDKIVDGLPAAIAGLATEADAFAGSILTTDTVPKIASATAGDARVVGVAKGAAMLAPNMATMLAFVVTDADVDEGTLQKVLDVAVERSFNRISVDACESTNDSVFMFATGKTPHGNIDDLVEATEQVCKELALAMVKDAEGGSKLVRISVEGAADESAACSLGRAVAASALWRAAVHGSDPNWGRVMSALGSADRSLELRDVSITIGDVDVFAKGEPVEDLTPAHAVMQGTEIALRCVVGSGPGHAEVLTSDLSPGYVTLNAEGTT